MRIAHFLNEKLREQGEEPGEAGFVLALDTGFQSTLAGAGAIFDEFRQSDKVIDYTGYGEEPTKFYDKENYHISQCRIMNFDETYYKMPYDCRSRNNFVFVKMYYFVYVEMSKK